jgi:hypothetical protein
MTDVSLRDDLVQRLREIAQRENSHMDRGIIVAGGMAITQR